MLQEQILTLRIVYDDTHPPPSDWNWDRVQDSTEGEEFEVLAFSAPREPLPNLDALADQLRAWSEVLVGYDDPDIHGLRAGMEEVAHDLEGVADERDQYADRRAEEGDAPEDF